VIRKGTRVAYDIDTVMDEPDLLTKRGVVVGYHMPWYGQRLLRVIFDDSIFETVISRRCLVRADRVHLEVL
jgi:hypothetical protein